jgi:peptide/nickel transport system permease protein
MTQASVIGDVAAPGAQPTSKISVRRRSPLATYIVKRIAAGIATVFVAAILIFIVIRVLPGSIVELVLGRNATPERVALIEQQLHLNDPLWKNFLGFVRGMLTGDLGMSTAGLVQGQDVPVSGMLASGLTNTLALALLTLVVLVPLTVVLGVSAGLRPGSARDHVISLVSLAFGAMPEFLLGTFLVVIFFSELGIFPPVSAIPPDSSPWEHPKLLVLPVLTLLLICMAFGVRMLRASVADLVNQDFVVVARINGASESEIIRKYILPNSLIPLVQTMAQQIQYLVGGVIVVENVFNFPGIGQALVQAIQIHDTQVIMVYSVLLAAFYIAVNVVADVVCILLDPKVRTTL